MAMTRTWARELGRYGIRVNAAAPGSIETDMVKSIPAKVLDAFREHTPLERLGKPEEIVEVDLWLASDGAAFVHGAVSSLDCGVVLGTQAGLATKSATKPGGGAEPMGDDNLLTGWQVREVTCERA